MNVKEFNAWLSRNVGSGGKRPKLDAFNKHLKGSERNPRAPEYPCKDVPEYNRYVAYQDLRDEDDDEQQEEEQSKQEQRDQQSRSNSQASQSAGRVAQSVARNVIPRVVVAVVGTVAITVVTYNEIKAREAQAVVASTSWSWAEDHTATLNFWNSDGNLIKGIPGTVEVAETPATCKEKGLATYTATATDSGTKYQDVYTAELPALGHDFGEGKKITIDGKDAMEYDCRRCHEIFTIIVDGGEAEAGYLTHWVWSEDHLDCHLELASVDGHIVYEGNPEVTTFVTEPTCSSAGETIYKANYTYDGHVYSDSYVEPIPALGHHLDEGTLTTIDGKDAIVYECDRCHETFTIIIDGGEIDPPDIVYPAHWHWSENHLDCRVELVNEDGYIILEDDAEVTSFVTDPTCNSAGEKVYQANYTYDGHLYSESYVEVTPALGHHLDGGTLTTIEGKEAIVYECDRCHETFTIVIDTEEEEGGDEEASHGLHSAGVITASHVHEGCHYCNHHHIH